MSFPAELVSWHVLAPGAVPPYLQDSAFLLVELHETSLNLPLQTVKLPLDGSTALI